MIELYIVVGVTVAAVIGRAFCLHMVLGYVRWAQTNGHEVGPLPELIHAALSPWRRTALELKLNRSKPDAAPADVQD